MENASKALLMAGGVLIALLVIGALVLMFNQLSSYQNSQTSSDIVDSISEYNQKFTRYLSNNTIIGTDVMTLMNKIIDNNSKSDVVDTINYNNKIKLNVKLGDGFANKYGTNGKLLVFDTKTYSIQGKNNAFYAAIEVFTNLENTYTIATMNKLSANYDTIKARLQNNERITNITQDIIGKSINIEINQIAQYREYSELKTSTFELVGEPSSYDNGQIKEISLNFKK